MLSCSIELQRAVSPNAASCVSPLCLLLVSLDPIDERLLSPLLGDGGLEVIRVSALSPKWIAFAQRTSAVVVVAKEDPLAALVYAVSAGIESPIVVAVPGEASPYAELNAAGAFWSLSLPTPPTEIRALTLALRSRVAQHRVDATLRFVVDPIACTVRLADRTARLTHCEFAVLDLLTRRAGMPVSAEALVTYVWSNTAPTSRTRRTLDVHVCNLRKKLAQVGLEDAITTARGFGYVLGHRASSRRDDVSATRMR